MIIDAAFVDADGTPQLRCDRPRKCFCRRFFRRFVSTSCVLVRLAAAVPSGRRYLQGVLLLSVVVCGFN